jgi:hypothetical protein
VLSLFDVDKVTEVEPANMATALQVSCLAICVAALPTLVSY